MEAINWDTAPCEEWKFPYFETNYEREDEERRDEPPYDPFPEPRPSLPWDDSGYTQSAESIGGTLKTICKRCSRSMKTKIRKER
jgi:hypothetical protein